MNFLNSSKLFLLVSIITQFPLDLISGDDWCQWRGPNRNSIIAGRWPDSLSGDNLVEIWSKPLEPSYSGPVVSDNKLFVTETRNKETEVVTAFDIKSGEQLWSQKWAGSMKVPFFAARNGSWIRSTPATDGNRIYVAGMLGKLACLNVKNGEIIWSFDLNERYGTNRESFGHVCSPMILNKMEEAIYIQCSAGFLKLNSLTGKEIWRTLQGSDNIMSGGAFSSPCLATLHGKEQILVQTRNDIAGVDIESGEVLWKHAVPNYRGMNILTPTSHENTVFTSSYQNHSFGFEISKLDSKLNAKEKWKLSYPAYMSSPIVIDGHAYMHLQNQQVACIDIAKGEMKWMSKLRPRFGQYWSMISNGKKILSLDSDGVLFLTKVDSEKYSPMGKADIKTKNSWAHLAVQDDLIIVRGLNSVTVYRWQ